MKEWICCQILLVKFSFSCQSYFFNIAKVPIKGECWYLQKKLDTWYVFNMQILKILLCSVLRITIKLSSISHLLQIRVGLMDFYNLEICITVSTCVLKFITFSTEKKKKDNWNVEIFLHFCDLFPIFCSDVYILREFKTIIKTLFFVYYFIFFMINFILFILKDLKFSKILQCEK